MRLRGEWALVSISSTAGLTALVLPAERPHAERVLVPARFASARHVETCVVRFPRR